MDAVTKYVESSLGIRTSEATARKIDELLPTLPERMRKVAKLSSTKSEVVANEARTDVSLITTSAMDRQREMVLPEGLDKTDYMLNPIVLFGHDQNKPVGKCLWIVADAAGKGWSAKSRYTKRPKDYVGEWLPDFVFAMIADGVLNGKSIQYIALEDRDPTDEERALHPELEVVCTKSMLLEYSVVSIPCNPEALVQVVTKGLEAGIAGWKAEKPKQKPEPKKKNNSYKSMAEALDRFTIDPEAIAKEVIDQLTKKWNA